MPKFYTFPIYEIKLQHIFIHLKYFSFLFCLNHIFWQFTFHFVRWTKFHHFTTPNQQCFHSNCYSVAHSCYYFPETLIKFHSNHISAHVGALFGKILINVSSTMAHIFTFYLHFWYFEANSNSFRSPFLSKVDKRSFTRVYSEKRSDINRAFQILAHINAIDVSVIDSIGRVPSLLLSPEVRLKYVTSKCWINMDDLHLLHIKCSNGLIKLNLYAKLAAVSHRNSRFQLYHLMSWRRKIMSNVFILHPINGRIWEFIDDE